MSEPQFTITLAQLNPTVGDVAGNAAKARAARAKAKAAGADLVVLSELFIAGYPPEDLVLKPAFQAACRAAIEELARETAGGGPAVLIDLDPIGGGLDVLLGMRSVAGPRWSALSGPERPPFDQWKACQVTALPAQ